MEIPKPKQPDQTEKQEPKQTDQIENPEPIQTDQSENPEPIQTDQIENPETKRPDQTENQEPKQRVLGLSGTIYESTQVKDGTLGSKLGDAIGTDNPTIHYEEF